VSIEVLSSFKKLKMLTEDPASIVDALRSSRLVELDATGSKVKTLMDMCVALCCVVCVCVALCCVCVVCVCCFVYCILLC
jgi:lipopolysaccharide/colanic/teichoic acid biosynthesis glycosyltransferase